jgi:hypothetical protein
MCKKCVLEQLVISTYIYCQPQLKCLRRHLRSGFLSFHFRYSLLGAFALFPVESPVVVVGDIVCRRGRCSDSILRFTALPAASSECFLRCRLMGLLSLGHLLQIMASTVVEGD